MRFTGFEPVDRNLKRVFKIYGIWPQARWVVYIYTHLRNAVAQARPNDGTSTQMFGGRRYETLPMQECKQNTTEEQNG